MQSLRFPLLLIFNLIFSSHVAAGSVKRESPHVVEGAETISIEQAKKMHADGMIFIDVRSPRQYKKRHIKGAKHLYLKDAFTEQNLLEIGNKETLFVLYCNGAHCLMSSKAARKAVAWGFTQIKYYRAGFRAWRLDGNPIGYGEKP